MEAGVWNVNPFDRRVPGGIRTPNLLIRSQLLYPVELQTPLLSILDFRFSIAKGKKTYATNANGLSFRKEFALRLDGKLIE